MNALSPNVELHNNCFNVGARLPLILLYQSSSVKYDGARLLRHLNVSKITLTSILSCTLNQCSSLRCLFTADVFFNT